MSQKAKPQIVPTLISSGVVVWSAVLLLLFVAVLMLYSSFVALQRVKGDLTKPVLTTIVTEAGKITAPAGWEAYANDDENVVIFRHRGSGFPLIRVLSTQDSKNLYHALDVNSALLVRRIATSVVQLAGTNSVIPAVKLSGSEIVTVKPGVSAVHFTFSTDEVRGEGLYFFLGDRRYLAWGMALENDVESCRDIQWFMNRPQNSLALPDLPEDIERPTVDSSKQTAESNRQTLDEVNRELALWRLFAERAKTEPIASLLPAINHFREAVQLLSSIRQENGIISGEDYERYLALKDQRAKIVSEWFVRLEKFRAMKDVEGAKNQAQFIADHLTLKGEGPLARQARDILAEIQAAGGGN